MLTVKNPNSFGQHTEPFSVLFSLPYLSSSSCHPFTMLPSTTELTGSFSRCHSLLLLPYGFPPRILSPSAPMPAVYYLFFIIRLIQTLPWHTFDRSLRHLLSFCFLENFYSSSVVIIISMCICFLRWTEGIP